MLLFLISFLSFILLSKSLVSWANEMRLLSHWYLRGLSCFLISLMMKRKLVVNLSDIFPTISFKKMTVTSCKVENVKESEEMSVLDLPELALECILGMLPPSALSNMASVCRSLKDRCRSDHLWERHLKEKWGRVIDHAAYREWQWQIPSRRRDSTLYQTKPKGLIRSLSSIWPLLCVRSNHENSTKLKTCLPVNSVMSLYLSLETGKFWFPAQVYNREHGHAGFMLSCYDAELCYDRRTDTFHARYPPHGRRTIVTEEGVQWDRIRAPPIDTPPHDLHISDCLSDLRPGNHIEIQWRRSKEFPYGWWYGVVGHLESCDGNEHNCLCHTNDTVVLEFNQYAPGSRWRRTVVDRNDHWEEGNETDGFYGGIRKLHSNEEIAVWKRLWPAEALE